MKKHKKKIIIISIVLIILIFIITIVRANKKAKEDKDEILGISPQKTPQGKSYQKVDCTRSTILERGIQCQGVLNAQKEINKVYHDIGISKLTEDGLFGSATESAFQKLLGTKNGTYNEVEVAVKYVKNQTI